MILNERPPGEVCSPQGAVARQPRPKADIAGCHFDKGFGV